MKILIIDDDKMTRDMYVRVFKEANFEVFETADGEEGLLAAVKEIPDIIFTGIHMPKMDGFLLMEALKKNESTAQIPVAISSHTGREEDRQKAMQMGAKDFIVRSYTSPIEAVKRIKSLFKESKDYFIPIESNSMGIQDLRQMLKQDGNIICPKCHRNLGLKLTLIDPQEMTFKMKLACKACD